MNLQDAASLTIPEGGVRNIRDGNGNLLWSSVGYNVRYDGDTFQQTYSGKNIWGNISSYSRSTNGIDFVTNTDGTITASGTASATAYSVLTSGAVSAGVYLTLQVGTYTLSEKNGNKVQAVVAESGGAIIADTSTSEVTFTLTQTTNVAIRASISSGTVITGTLTLYPMLEIGPQPTSYEPYVGGIPAPNPDYPQPINVVTGTQTISITDGTDTQNLAVDLGAVELCKIGDYQDYIYKSGDDWYVHKDIGKYTFVGNEAWRAGAYGVNSWTLDNVITTSFDTTKVQVICNLFKGIAHDDRTAEGENLIYLGSNIRLWVRNTDLLTETAIQEATNGNYAYYALATPTDTQITDATLISQLNVVHNWLIRHDYSGTVSGNLPIIINRTGLT